MHGSHQCWNVRRRVRECVQPLDVSDEVLELRRGNDVLDSEGQYGFPFCERPLQFLPNGLGRVRVVREYEHQWRQCVIAFLLR